MREKEEGEKERKKVVRGKGGPRAMSGFAMGYEHGGVF